jgi:osmotically-inducible protein OsmY
MTFSSSSDNKYYILDQAHNLQLRIERIFSRHQELCNSRVQVEMGQGTVILKGQVSSYYRKQLAQELLKSIVTDQRVRNDLTVIAREFY